MFETVVVLRSRLGEVGKLQTSNKLSLAKIMGLVNNLKFLKTLLIPLFAKGWDDPLYPTSLSHFAFGYEG